MKQKGIDMAPAVEAAVASIKDPVVVATPRTHRAVLTYKDTENPKAPKLKLYIREGIVMNPKVDEAIAKGIQANTLTAVRLRRTREAVRVLERTAEV